MDTIHHTQEYLQAYGIKPSVQRIAIVDYLINHRTHPTADEIYSALYTSIPTLSKTTVYNTLKLFTEQKAILSLIIDEKNVRFDIDTSCHAHFQCCICNQVYDIPVEKDQELLQIKKIGDLAVTESHLYYKGYCKNCNKNE